jgi:hypothetical protein
VFLVTAGEGGGITLTCEKLSRAARPAPIEVTLTVETDPANPAEWRSARLEAIGQGGDWRVDEMRRLRPSERKALQALDDFRAEGGLSWSQWAAVTELSSRAINEARKTLVRLGYAQADQTGTRGGRPTFRYAITGPGTAALLTLDADGTATVPPTVLPSASPDGTDSPPVGGASNRGREAIAPLEPDSTYEDVPSDPGYWVSLAGEEPPEGPDGEE